MTTEDLCRHEAGHACAAALFGRSVRLVDTVPRTEPTPGGGLCVIYGETRHSGERVVDRASAIRRMVVILCGPLESADSWDEMPHWPLSEDADTTDERNLAALADWLGFDEADYTAVVMEAIKLSLTPAYLILHQAISGLVDYVPRIDAALFERVHPSREGTEMEHLLLKAVATTTTDLGEFEAVISTSAIDREGDVVEPAAMVDALQAWTVTGKVVPLHWNHQPGPENIVGHVDPHSVKAQGDEVHPAGKVDLDTDRGRQVWRLMKAGSVGFSFGALIPEGGAVKRAGGGKHIVQLDLFEITVTAGPMNAQTRVLATKALDEHNTIRDRVRREMFEALAATLEPVTKSIDPPPVQIASFEC
jgi:HK97 family phage prohead protease